MFVVKRPFRDTYGMIVAGSVIEPANVKRFRSRLFDGHIVEVTEQNFDKYSWYFKNRFGVELQKLTKEEPVIETEIVEEPVIDTEEPLVKPIVKTVAVAASKVIE